MGMMGVEPQSSARVGSLNGYLSCLSCPPLLDSSRNFFSFFSSDKSFVGSGASVPYIPQPEVWVTTGTPTHVIQPAFLSTENANK